MSDKNPTDYLELKSDGSFFLQEGPIGAAGKYEIEGTQITLKLDMGLASRGTIEGDTLIDKDGTRWIRGKRAGPQSSSQDPSSPPPGPGVTVRPARPSTPAVSSSLLPREYGVYAIVTRFGKSELVKLNRPSHDFEGGFPGERDALEQFGLFHNIPFSQQSLNTDVVFVWWGPYGNPLLWRVRHGQFSGGNRTWSNQIAREDPLALEVSAPLDGRSDMFSVKATQPLRVNAAPNPPDLYVFSVDGCKDNSHDGRCYFPIGVQ